MESQDLSGAEPSPERRINPAAMLIAVILITMGAITAFVAWWRLIAWLVP